jgi:hypothetical protein
MPRLMTRLVDRKDDGMGRQGVDADDALDLLGEARVVGALEAAPAVGAKSWPFQMRWLVDSPISLAMAQSV